MRVAVGRFTPIRHFLYFQAEEGDFDGEAVFTFELPCASANDVMLLCDLNYTMTTSMFDEDVRDSSNNAPVDVLVDEASDRVVLTAKYAAYSSHPVMATYQTTHEDRYCVPLVGAFPPVTLYVPATADSIKALSESKKFVPTARCVFTKRPSQSYQIPRAKHKRPFFVTEQKKTSIMT